MVCGGNYTPQEHLTWTLPLIFCVRVVFCSLLLQEARHTQEDATSDNWRFIKMYEEHLIGEPSYDTKVQVEWQEARLERNQGNNTRWHHGNTRALKKNRLEGGCFTHPPKGKYSYPLHFISSLHLKIWMKRAKRFPFHMLHESLCNRTVQIIRAQV
jgi:hypothetical protein